MSQASLTPTKKAANQLTASARPVQQAKSDALKNQVWMSEKNPRKRAASNIAEPDIPKQARIRKKSPPPVNQNTAQLFDSDSDGNESDNKLEESDEDIQGLDSKKLKATLDYKRPLFAPPDKTNGSTTSVNSHSRANSSTSSMRSIASTPSDSDNDGLSEDKGLTSKNLSGPRYRPLKQKSYSKTNEQGALKGGKRLQKREQEKPTWRTPEVDHSISDRPPADEQLEVTAKSVRSCEDDWPARCRIVYSGSGKVNLTDQQAHIQDMIHASITCLHKHLLFENAYPELQQQRKLMADILMSCTKDGEEFDAVRKRLAKDPNPKVRLGASMATFERQHKRQAPAVLDTIEDAFFSDELAAGLKWHDDLTSTLEDHHDEVELPVAMVALASAAVCSVIMQYSSEKYDRDFNLEMYGGIYRTLVGVLNGIFQASERKFHVLVHGLYKFVHGSKRKTDEPGAAESLMFLDIEGMADE
ncbi:uncharacterized protein EDB91DRAFT_1347703 [Suillus paluster]|uniref:uncharacterized protein n=1 Tax=Suillus paluster TaxID=48578 RepID=UPI001B868858|nr:uncharacterized protein EDB91DRAFT_1347703 [Suillus paluster]KAG1738097.1 hypothetical protein EDB91DRAFT_1347703 [Suillus paluster]